VDLINNFQWLIFFQPRKLYYHHEAEMIRTFNPHFIVIRDYHQKSILSVCSYKQGNYAMTKINQRPINYQYWFYPVTSTESDPLTTHRRPCLQHLLLTSSFLSSLMRWHLMRDNEWPCFSHPATREIPNTLQ
jgi:hypothetical protein